MSSKILFVIPSMEIGGTRSSLLNLLNELSTCCDAQLYLFLVQHEGELFSQIPPTVNVLPEIKMLSWATPSKTKPPLYRKLFHSCVAILNRICGYQLVYRAILRLNRTRSIYSYDFDIAIGYQEGIATFISSEFDAKYHYAWIHSDIEKWFNAKNFEYNSYENAQNILFVAENTKNQFVYRFPCWKSKCEVVHNLLNKDLIIRKSQEPILDLSFDLKNFNLVSIGRFTEVKAFDRIISASNYLRTKNKQFRWYLIGDGEQFEKIERMIFNEKLNDYVILLGPKNNPFPYIKQADLIVVSSINESQPMVILEALSLSVPVLSTGYPSAREVLQDGKYGFICENDTNSLCLAVETIMTDKCLYNKMKLSANEYEYNNKDILDKMKRVIPF